MNPEEYEVTWPRTSYVSILKHTVSTLSDLHKRANY